MVPAKYSGRVLLLTTMSLVLVSVSLSASWYDVNGVDFYPTYYQHSSSYLTPYEAADSAYDNVRDILALQAALVFIWIALGIVFVAAVIKDYRWLSVISGFAVLIIGFVAVFQFAARIDDAAYVALRDSVTRSAPPFDGFMGVETNTDGYLIHYGPDIGFWMVLVALVMHVIASFFRYAAVMEWQVTRWRIWGQSEREE